MKPIYTIGLLVVSNLFMTLAWYGHLKIKSLGWFSSLGLFSIIILSWGLAFFEYLAQVPANKYGYIENGGTFNLFQLKIIQEVITLITFTVFTLIFFKTEQFKLNHVLSFICLVFAVYFAFKK
ncbi:MAG: DMT family protein [Saprospiraceae bacterium]|uniref:DMT family protein n=1 Tax=Candidatus Defluviibacterium haderslevense TaxID=2981993 RepID=A0A9D7XF71_9BACT|nr:DMT family protein [Candidatus Defluviibacterium haderslevense]MBL0236507.1 DMT family protein [Candidatus Defluviibacterium haderslevense]MCC7028314.1 DMT family protein [Saprospiraceae bacterium]